MYKRSLLRRQRKINHYFANHLLVDGQSLKQTTGLLSVKACLLPDTCRGSTLPSSVKPMLKVSVKELIPSHISLCLGAQAEMWIDFINSSVAPAAKAVLDQVMGNAAADISSFSRALKALTTSLESIEKHLRLRNFLVGHQLTLADALLVSTVSQCFELVLDKKARDGPLANIARYTTLILRMPPFKRAFGSPFFCKDVIKPVFEDIPKQVKTA